MSSAAVPRHAFLSYSRVRTFASTSHLSSDHPPSSQSTSSSLLEEEKDSLETKPASESSQHIPWYLQEETSVPTGAEVFSQDQLPELPENPPKILPELLEYVFKDLGLDELKLIDLRRLETPAALGANVIMIIGTARSVKHLNVSADRLCRWLRSSHKLTPYADGLLGRNELKIKLRRKARRARLASRTGAMSDDKDDGITTGWICVNAGVVEKGPVQEQPAVGFEGFGHLQAGTRVVVQMFTEEKRADIDLEGLWEGRLARAQKAKQQLDVPVDADAGADAPEKVRSPNSNNSSPSDYESPNVPRSSVSSPFEQRRQFHSISRRQISHSTSSVADTPLFKSWADASSPVENQSSQPHESSILLQDLSGMPVENIKSALGEGADDQSSTDFLRNFYATLQGAPADIRVLSLLELTCMAISHQHPGYSKERAHRAFMDCCICGCDIPDRLASQVVTFLLAPRISDGPEAIEYLPEEDKEMALAVLDQVILRGANMITLKLFTLLYSAAALPASPGEFGEDFNPAERSAHILRMIDTLSIPFEPTQARNLMLELWRNGEYDGFYKWWRRLPLNNSPRTYDDYEMLFRLHAELGDGALARECVTTMAPMMEREDPPIALTGKLVQHLMDCIVLADEKVEHRAAEGSQNHFAKLWQECLRSRGEKP
ncbi:ATPase synthesis protein 25, mitochondrial [Aspergillus egyptiacus]|nr:ATPase synthesis protein 25, mitochondrial [Aspergillus egyptiacus]